VSRKDLSRTVIEGGRTYYSSHQRRASHGIARAHARAWLTRVRVDGDVAEAAAPRPPRRVPKAFHDKLGPALRWLGSNAGRPWSKVFSELCAEFDTRTLAGHHVVHDHMLDWVDTGDESNRRRNTNSRYYFYVDGNGILRRPAWSRKAYRKLRADTKAWAAGRYAALDHRGWWWYLGKVAGKPCATPTYTCPCKHSAVNYVNYHLLFRRQTRMTTSDVTRLIKLPPELRKELVFEVRPVVRGRR
jgi:hypothetical protein